MHDNFSISGYDIGDPPTPYTHHLKGHTLHDEEDKAWRAWQGAGGGAGRPPARATGPGGPAGGGREAGRHSPETIGLRPGLWRGWGGEGWGDSPGRCGR